MNPWLSSPLHFSLGFVFLCSQNSCDFDQRMVNHFAQTVSHHVGSLAMSHAGFIIVSEMLQDESGFSQLPSCSGASGSHPACNE